jgi:uridine phosphorylase
MIPNYRDKYDADAVVTPADAVTEQGDGLPTVPAAVILGYQEELTRVVREQARAPIDIVRSQRLFPVRETAGYVPVHEWGIGAPVTATVTENLIAAGAEGVAILGGCACLQPGVSADVAILPTEAIRDEGVSYHYVPGETPVTPTERLVESLTDQLASAGFDTRQAPTWTTSAMYRETRPEVEQYRDDGVVSLGMESAAMWAVCQYRGADAATVQEIGDYLAPDEWVPQANSDRGTAAMLEPTIRALAEHVSTS